MLSQLYRLHSSLLVVSIATSVMGCGAERSNGVVPMDASVSRDAVIVSDAVLVLDSSSARDVRSDSRSTVDASFAPADASIPGFDAGSVSDSSRPVPDSGFSACATGSCDPTRPGTCGDAASCVLLSTGARCGVAGAVGLGETCSVARDCSGGLMCMRVGDALRCEQPCCAADGSTSNTCRLGTSCVGIATTADGTPTAFGRCVASRTCAVFGDDCEPGEACYIVSGTGATDCRIAGDFGDGDLCNGPNSCQPGLVCAGITDRTCARLCTLSDGGGNACEAGFECRAYAYTPPGTGVCTAP